MINEIIKIKCTVRTTSSKEMYRCMRTTSIVLLYLVGLAYNAHRGVVFELHRF